jgi:peptidoglycan biosynthesis protein MviN/MurJ (putative lipid II flippase)
MLMTIGPVALLAALISVPMYYLAYRRAQEPKRPRSVARYLLVVLVVGAAAYAIGTVIGIAVACASDTAGNLCGLAGVFGVGPLLAAAAIVLYAHAWAKNARHSP